jgi:hypothetical protein
VERSAKEHAAPLPSWPELLEIGVRRFAEVSARQRPNDLSAAEEAENWEMLLRECALAGVVVDDTVRQLADGAVKRARAANAGAGVDMRSLDSDELVALLERKELRREAALILCERHEPARLPAVFSAIRRMARAEANLVLPAVCAFGAAAEKWLVEVLHSKKSFMRQGCALALGTLKTPHGVDALVRMLLEEPTEIWSEAARALGDAGPMAVMPLAARLRDVDADRRERIVQALAQVAARPGHSSPVEMLAEGRDALVAASAQRALALVDEVGREDQVVRRGTSDQTVVRGFSRRFYDALSGGASAIELGPGDLEEITESDDDEDLRTATDLPALSGEGPSSRASAPRIDGPIDGTTDPTPRTSLPRDR